MSTSATSSSSSSSSSSQLTNQTPWFRRPEPDLYPHTPCGKQRWRHSKINGRFTISDNGDESALSFMSSRNKLRLRGMRGLKFEMPTEGYYESEADAMKRSPLTPPTAPFYPFASQYDYDWARGFFNNFHLEGSEHLMKMWIDSFLWEGLDDFQICSFQTANELWGLLEAVAGRGGVEKFMWNPPLDARTCKVQTLCEATLAGRRW
ncbi:hypothetical protein FN846DRAFT_970452 [Sphaerosporella brunnea]|uniref:Uncharacterized protein n=1 Tax=Sphaerosporella brunnea TaxID=1250544 RepID=A0A5J5EHR5_9PEZI|nr:hypothetical protein FN846DRAFT_970452 [Sphaerosporella brunnea]